MFNKEELEIIEMALEKKIDSTAFQSFLMDYCGFDQDGEEEEFAEVERLLQKINKIKDKT